LALVVHKLFGEGMLKTQALNRSHFYNEIDGRVYEFTASQLVLVWTSRVFPGFGARRVPGMMAREVTEDI
jgi:hypothetical protein